MYSISSRSYGDMNIADKTHLISSSGFCTLEHTASNDIKSGSDNKSGKSGHDESVADNSALSKMTCSASSAASEVSCYSTERKSTYLGENDVSSIPGSPRNKFSHSEHSASVPDGYDYSSSTEHNYAISSGLSISSSTHPSSGTKTGDKYTPESLDAKEKDKGRVMTPLEAYEYPHQKVPRNVPLCVGKYGEQRKALDYSYHAQYKPERQLFHDELIG